MHFSIRSTHQQSSDSHHSVVIVSEQINVLTYHELPGFLVCHLQVNSVILADWSLHAAFVNLCFCLRHFIAICP